MKDFVKDVVNDGEFLLKDILKERVGVNRPRTLIGVWIDEENRWEKIKVHKNDIVQKDVVLILNLTRKNTQSILGIILNFLQSQRRGWLLPISFFD